MIAIGLYIIGGANGSEKTTAALQILPTILEVFEYVNMEKLNYPEIVQDILARHVKNCSNRQTEIQLLFDTERNRYQVMNIGWQELTRVFGCIIYIEIKKGKIWIERDGTEIGIANELVEAGVLREDIILAFKAPYKRKFTDFAAS